MNPEFKPGWNLTAEQVEIVEALVRDVSIADCASLRVQAFRDRVLGKPYMRELDREILRGHTASIQIPPSLHEREIDDCK